MLRVVKGIEAKVNRSEGCQRLGYGRSRSPSPRVLSLIDSEIKEAHVLIKSEVYYAIRSIMGVDHSRLLVDGMTFSSLRIAPTFSGCSQVAIFVATIGGRLEERVAQLMKEGLMLEALIMDIIGSVAVEKVAGWLENMIRNVAAENGSKIGWRYSPGYCDWDITQQRELFRAFDGKSIGINLTRECLMIPRKSISGIVGIGESCITYSACRCCNKKNCPTRREEFAP